MSGKSELKEKLDYGQLPALEFNGKIYTQSICILRFLARQYGYYPTDDFDQQYEVDNIMDSFQDYNFGLLKAYTSADAKGKNEGLKSFFTTHSTKFFNAWDTKIKENGK